MCKICIKNTTSGLEYCTPECRNVALAKGDLGSIDTMELEESLAPVQVKECKTSGCHALVFWDYKTEFIYCSPSCRDNDMLKGSQRKLRQDIEEMEGVISKLPKSTFQGAYQSMTNMLLIRFIVCLFVFVWFLCCCFCLFVCLLAYLPSYLILFNAT